MMRYQVISWNDDNAQKNSLSIKLLIILFLIVIIVSLYGFTAKAITADDVVARADELNGKTDWRYNDGTYTYCLLFVSDFWSSTHTFPDGKAGLGFQGSYGWGSAYNYCNNYKVSSSMDDIPIGADVFFDDYNKSYGHIGIYVGNGRFLNAAGEKIRISSFYNDKWDGNFWGNNYKGWGWHQYVNIETKTGIRGSEMTTGFSAVLSDGDYLIATAATVDKSALYFLDIENASAPAANNSNVSLCGPLTGDPEAYDVWTIEYDNQFYKIKQKGTNMCLDVDNEDTLQETNIQVYSGWDTNAQKWAVERNGVNGYRLRSKCSGSGNHPMCLDITGGVIANGTNVQQWEYNNSDAQSWLLIPYNPSQPIDEGRYILLYTSNPSYELDVAGNTGVINNGTNVQIWSDSISSRYNSFDFIKLSNGYYKVIHAASGKCLEVEGGSSNYKTNVSLHSDNGSIAQQWAVVKNGSGYSLVSKCNGYALDLPSGITGDGKNLEVFPRLESDNQRWTFVKAEHTITYNANGSADVPKAQTKYYKENLTLSKSIPQRSNYVFLGWTTTPDGAVTYHPGDVFETDENLTLYAVWLADETILKLPSELKRIEGEAFANVSASAVMIPSGVIEIEAGAFDDIVILGYKGTVAEEYANTNGLTFISLDDN